MGTEANISIDIINGNEWNLIIFHSFANANKKGCKYCATSMNIYDVNGAFSYETQIDSLLLSEIIYFHRPYGIWIFLQEAKMERREIQLKVLHKFH